MRFNKKISEKLELIRVSSLNKDINFLFHLLKLRNRKNSISHRKIPSLKEHKKFILSKPYRYWFIIKFLDNYYGSLYLTRMNSIAIHMIKNNHQVYEQVLLYVINNIKPLKPIPSIRPGTYFLNFPVNEKVSSSIVKKLGGKINQVSYHFK